MFDGEESVSDTLRQLRQIWINTTEDSVTRDLERARELVDDAAPEDRETARGYLEALERLGRWLHDR